jgi:CubicO group peptidase (beta-lactamase class C family)
VRAVHTLSLLGAMLLSGASGSQQWPTHDWARGSPAALGIDSSKLEALDQDIAKDKYPLVDSILVIRCGLVAFERTYHHDYAVIFSKEARTPGPLNAFLNGRFNFFDASFYPFHGITDLHSLQSVSKTVTSAIIGTAITRGDFKASLDTPVLQFFDASKVENVDERKRRMTIRALLTMTAGLDWNEDVSYDDPRNDDNQMERSDDWVRYVINRPMAREPGQEFVYNSGATELLAYIFARETGYDIEQYAEKYLFAPLGIRAHFWSRTPGGIVDAVGGLFLTREDLAKLGYLYLNSGEWAGQRILSAAWVHESVTPVVNAREGWKYGYQWWLKNADDQPGEVWAARGWGGQRLIVYPREDLILVLTGWSIPVTTSHIEQDAMRRVLESAQPHRCDSTAR